MKRKPCDGIKSNFNQILKIINSISCKNLNLTLNLRQINFLDFNFKCNVEFNFLKFELQRQINFEIFQIKI